MDCPGTGYGVSVGTWCWSFQLGRAKLDTATTVSADRPWLLWPREEDRPQAGSPSLSQREVSIDGLACELSQAMAGSGLVCGGMG